MVSLCISVAEVLLELGPGDEGLEGYAVILAHKFHHHLRSSHIEALGHTHTEVSRPDVVERGYRLAQFVVCRVVVAAVACEGYYVVAVLH